jgi:branched-subunit amino acid aminotransferase/4-amino-4-deoxychorismate lyase
MKNRTLLFGEGLFETFRVFSGRRLAFVEDHLKRMADGSLFFGLPFSKEKAGDALRRALEEIPSNAEARLRLNLVSYGGHQVERTNFETTWELLQERGTFQNDQGVKLDFAPFQRFSGSPLVRFKTTSYLENIYVLRWARNQGLFDGIFTNERNEITEGSICNFFFLRRGQVFTPPVDAGLLPGITRKQVIELARALKYNVEESDILRGDLDHFDGAFVTNSIVGILAVSHLADAVFEVPEAITSLQDAYQKRVETSALPMNQQNP